MFRDQSGEITKKTKLSRPAVSHHLQVLKDAGIINVRREGTMNYYYINTNDTQWEKITQLMISINELVKKVSAQKKMNLRSCNDE